ncbi:MAG: energy transducer TonB [Herminiimonas sp.]|nr:energy transducer TonB [Herminiimonas sp.]MDB5855291.1 energy transducer TonB [Herminiimonas sp.]
MLQLVSVVSYAASPEDGITEFARLIVPLQIVYPPKAERYEEEGTVALKIRVLANGSASDIVVSKSSGYPLLDAAALKSAMGVRFLPAKNILDMPIDSTVLLPVTFKLLPGKLK